MLAVAVVDQKLFLAVFRRRIGFCEIQREFTGSQSVEDRVSEVREPQTLLVDAPGLCAR
ncbi:hypothetical protein QQ987_20500 (plasmid) [Sphingobium baderi]|nr:hypothetical protein [Sphingobium baderi]WRD78765.1 hypothetical protein QQ987_20500 [Sphingobium baderi]